MDSIRIGAAIGAAVIYFTLPLGARADQAPAVVPVKCVSIGKPKPNLD